jgi:nucleoside-diphosphate-sugar epimerase
VKILVTGAAAFIASPVASVSRAAKVVILDDPPPVECESKGPLHQCDIRDAASRHFPCRKARSSTIMRRR